MEYMPQMPDHHRHHSPHVPVPGPGCEKLTWEPLGPGGMKARVRDYTCDCQPTYYELCQSGGQHFIRRTRRIGDEVVVDECARGRHTKTIVIWGKLLAAMVA
ncbi:hypothetical protein [Nonomuraea sp. NPDC050643]|uniref:hypothetical protein n=1 Tax=Nonomuraea sp. NPDC050643 TaxID=3155660 RepID=UPI0033E97322